MTVPFSLPMLVNVVRPRARNTYARSQDDLMFKRLPRVLRGDGAKGRLNASKDCRPLATGRERRFLTAWRHGILAVGNARQRFGRATARRERPAAGPQTMAPSGR